MKNTCLATLLLAFVPLSCTANQSRGAAAGATRGAFSGAAAGAVSALIFGGDVAESAARGAVWAGTAGAVGGAMVGTEVDRQQAQRDQAQAERELAELRSRIGEDAFSGLGALADCKHEVALAYARSAATSSSPNHALAAVWLEVLTDLDQGRGEEAKALYPTLAQRSEEVATPEQAYAKALEALEVVRDYREKEGRPRVCQ